MDHSQETAVAAYLKKTGRHFVPGEVVEVPLGALAFAEHQQPWLSLESYEKDRCIYDRETNEWLIWLVTECFEADQETLEEDHPALSPIYIDVRDHGVALVDGCHRTTSAFINNHKTILAQVNAA